MFGICDVSCAPVRCEPSHRSETVTELLFGESLEIIGEKDEWVNICLAYDEYTGWLPRRMFAEIKEKDYKLEENNFMWCSYELVGSASAPHRHFPILMGSTLPYFDGINFKINRERFTFTGRATNPNSERNESFLKKTAMMYLHAPYKWGGRTPFGIDCSGFTQMVFKLMNIRLKRDAALQAEQGSFITFMEETKIGDLAFFGEAEKGITHVGIILEEGKIIHGSGGSGRVRIDKIDQHGIFNEELKKYTHKLRFIKRVF